MSRQHTMTKVSVKKSSSKGKGGKHKTREVRIRPTDNGGFIVQHDQENAQPDEPGEYTPPPPMEETGHEDRAGMVNRLNDIFPEGGSSAGGSSDDDSEEAS